MAPGTRRAKWPAGGRFRRSAGRQSGRLGAVAVNLFVGASRHFGRERDDMSRLDLGPAWPEQIAQHLQKGARRLGADGLRAGA
ncbi:MAG: hypothetical protein OET79_17120, partial [Nitrospirota bacterium]|nr:hypothetical protein [Nitrospirota bacterium]